MSTPLRPAPGHRHAIAAIVAQDLRAWVRERVFFILSFVGVFVYAGVSYLLPTTVDETFRLAVRAPAAMPAMLPAQDGLEVVRFETTQELVDALLDDDRDLLVGLDFHDDTPQRLAAGQVPRVTVHVSPEAPPELAAAARVMVQELAFSAANRPLPVTLPDRASMVRGEERLGRQASLREKMRPLAALLVLALEMMSLAALVSRELQQRTVVAVLATPATVADWIAAKLLFGSIVALSQSLLLLSLIGALASAPGPLLVLVVLGTLLFTAMGLVAGARAKEFTEVLFYSFLFMVPAIVPAFSVLVPGASSPFVKALPTYPLAVAIFEASSGAPLSSLVQYIAWTAAWVVVLGAVATWFSTRQLRRS